MRNMRNESKSFTLIELLVVVCVIAILVAILMPATRAMFRKGDQMQCLSQGSMIGKASATYASTFGYTVDHVRRYNPYYGVGWGATYFEDAIFGFGYKSDPDESSEGLSYRTTQELFQCPLDTTGGTRSYVLNWDPNYGKGWRANLTIPMGRRGNINQDDTAYGPYNRGGFRNSISGVRSGMHRSPSTVLLLCERWASNNWLGGYSHCQFQRFVQGEFGNSALQKPCLMFVDGHVQQVAPSVALALDCGNDRDPDDNAW